MKRLWKVVPPCMSDILGFEEVLNHTDGIGIIDDAGHYKPLMHEHPEGGHGGGPREGGHGKKGFGGEVRVISSDISESDIITGTEKKLNAALKRGVEEYNPGFILITTAPCASMINTDIEAVAEQAAEKYRVPSAAVKLDGQRDYLYGISRTLEAMSKLLLKKAERTEATVNILGCNSIDWSKESIAETEKWIEENGFHVLSRWGIEEKTENLKKASSAALNLVVNAAGFNTARYMEREFGIPYVAGAPFGKGQCERLLNEMKRAAEGQVIKKAEQPEAVNAEVLVIGEQLEADAIRAALTEKGFGGVCVMSFYEMDKASMREGDKKLVSESDLEAALENDSLRLVIADSDYKPLCSRKIRWISLPNPANQSAGNRMPKFSQAGEKLDRWIEGWE